MNTSTPNPIIALAPMDGITDISFRLMTEKYFKSLNTVFTEFINVQGLFSNFELFVNRLRFLSNEPNIIVQYFGNVNQLEYFKKAVRLAKILGFRGIDINMGCPDKNIVKGFSGSGLIGRVEDVKKIISTVREEINSNKYDLDTNILKIVENLKIKGYFNEKNPKPTLSIKTRLGHQAIMDDCWWQFLDSLNLDFITIHGRTASQKYQGSSNWKHIQKLKNKMKTPIIGNGDILNSDMIPRKLKITPQGVMIGRGLLGNPEFNNAETREIKKQIEFIKEYRNLYFQYNKLFDPFKKHIVWYLAKVPNIKNLKIKMITTTRLEDLDNIIKTIY